MYDAGCREVQSPQGSVLRRPRVTAGVGYRAVVCNATTYHERWGRGVVSWSGRCAGQPPRRFNEKPSFCGHGRRLFSERGWAVSM